MIEILNFKKLNFHTSIVFSLRAVSLLSMATSLKCDSLVSNETGSGNNFVRNGGPKCDYFLGLK